MNLRLGSGPALFTRSWIPKEPERCVVLVHGFGEHSGRYERFGSWLASRGVAVFAYDQRGHGQTVGRRGHVERFDDFIADLRAVIGHAAAEYPGLPLAVIGHSMGGLVTARLACLGCDSVDAYVLSGPLIALASDVAPFKARIIRLLRRLIPRYQLDGGVHPEWLSRDEEVVRAYSDDPLVHGQMTLSLGAEILATQKLVLVEASQVAAPLLLLHGMADRLCAPEGSEQLYRGLAAEVSRVSELVLLPELFHEIFNEIGREAVFEKVLSWLQRQDSAARPAESQAEGT
jgi:acylglycerol lipase